MALSRLKLFAPRIQQPPTDTELLRECYDVVALRQPVHGHLPKGLWKLAHTFLRHLPPLPNAKCANLPCLNLGGQSNISGRFRKTTFNKFDQGGKISLVSLLHCADVLGPNLVTVRHKMDLGPLW